MHLCSLHSQLGVCEEALPICTTLHLYIRTIQCAFGCRACSCAFLTVGNVNPTTGDPLPNDSPPSSPDNGGSGLIPPGGEGGTGPGSPSFPSCAATPDDVVLSQADGELSVTPEASFPCLP